MLLRKIYSRTKHFTRSYYTVNSRINGKDENFVAKQLYNKIKATGPIPVADYMREILVNPIGGYYMHKDVFGSSGDFITSPELSQMFGEMVAVWCLNEWSKIGCPKPFQIVELGPGKGSLSEDILRVFGQFKSLSSCSLSLVEVSPYLSKLQGQRLCLQSNNVSIPSSPFYKEGIAQEGVQVKWYKRLEDVPDIFSIVIAHEFFDALPIHKFQKTENGYREVLIDIDQEEGKFRYVISCNETPALKTCLKPSETREHLEVSLESLLTIKTVANKLESFGGLALIADYGHGGEGTDTFRAFKQHKLHDPLVQPGTADLTADVDFGRLKEAALEGDKVIAFGPVTQKDFLNRMGIEHRYRALENIASKEQMEALRMSYKMMMDEDQMGKRFKFMCLVPAVLEKIVGKYPVVGFS
ncbi:protein arginine methyltransferase NDUFAF7 homolog, mitochondrial [Coccinella septempunctata]|uniref:protein arginine methyltransferase NDUFAF7 homolog, mitochondrial n=1 Tax=Coccinella septempunctata TaxID=41139 RepID=UPI001D098F97|nr:protein arginine methyltransferase NDUFAF7 homolog, mitochondrial [Coccinella septempunctata]